MSLKMGGMNHITKGTVIYQENSIVDSISLLFKGKVTVSRNGVVLTLASGNFIGLCDLYHGSYQCTCTVAEDAVVYPFKISDVADIGKILAAKKEYGPLMVTSLNRYIRNLYLHLSSIQKEIENLYSALMDTYDIYWEEGDKMELALTVMPAMEELAEYEPGEEYSAAAAMYYSECSIIPVEVQKEFYRTEGICLYNIEEQAALVVHLVRECTAAAGYLLELLSILYEQNGDCLLGRLVSLIFGKNKEGRKSSYVLYDAVESMVQTIYSLEKYCRDKIGVQFEVNHKEIRSICENAVTGGIPEEEEQAARERRMALKNSVDIILNYGKINQNSKNEFKETLQAYKNLKDKASSERDAQSIRKQLSKSFFCIYKSVFLCAYEKKDLPIAVELFLKYGYMDETMLKEEQLAELLDLDDTKVNAGPCHVYNMKQWLERVYGGKELPSKSEFDEDFEQNLRTRQKSKELTEAQAKAEFADLGKRLDYELDNMFQYNERLLSGQVTSFVPILREESFINGVRKSYVTAEAVNKAISKLQKVDYSVFYRELTYENQAVGINREYIMKEVFPDIILFPVSGENAVMWQDLSGRSRTSRGRFLLPIFTVKRLEELLIKLLGRYRWEYCRTNMGSAWNNIKYPSLTSEYMDYIQFYRKNRELSEDKKKLVKSQIQKCRNNSREVFVMDYEMWVKNESQGALRLNKVARDMLATYCPFAKPIRERVESQPLFQKAMSRYEREKRDKIRELEVRQRLLEKESLEFPKELQDTLDYYKEL